MIPASIGQYVLIPFIQIFVVLNAVALCVAYSTLLERKVIAWMQVRIGPNRVGPRGLLQPIADGLKLFLKEDLTPAGADKMLFYAAPLAALMLAFAAFAPIAFGPAEPVTTTLFGLLKAPVEVKPWIISDLNVGVLYILALSSLGVYGIIFAGWASNSKYSLLGGLRSASQVISYEIALGLSLLGPILMAGSLRLHDIVEAQRRMGVWFALPQAVSFFIFFIASYAETNRAPFDLPEAESELVAGFHTEYSGMKFAFFFLAEYASMILVSFLAALVFMGGWTPWLPVVGWKLDAAMKGIPVLGTLTPLFWLVPKAFVFMYGFLWVRATFPRYRYDQLMDIGWKWLIPLGFVNVLATGLIKYWMG
jgi:NADH-quinone oxidoreductase subunit H